ncbi:hypothetical protein ACLKA6_010117 [Drosophila palustris]
MRHHITQVRAKLTTAVNKFNWIIGGASKLPRTSKMLFFKQCVAPIWRYAIVIWGALASSTQFNRIETRNSRMIRTISKLHQAIRDRYNLQSVHEVFESASHNFATSLATHTNIEARKTVTNPFTPNRLNWPRYSEQLNSHILPVQQLHGHQQQQQDCQQQNSNYPTLIQQKLDEHQIRIQEQEQLRQEQLLARRREQPVRRLDEHEINSLRRRYASGELTRVEIEARIEGQHWQIQQLVLPELHQDRPRVFPEGWLTRKEYYRRRRQQGKLSGRLARAAAINIPDCETILLSDDDDGSVVVISEQAEQHHQGIDHYQHQEIQNPHLSNSGANHGGRQQQQQDPIHLVPQKLDENHICDADEQQPHQHLTRRRWQLKSSCLITNTWNDRQQPTPEQYGHTHERRPLLS